MNRKVLIAGAGQLGSRYLQGLSKIVEPTEIWVFDISVDSLMRAQQRWSEMQPTVTHKVHYISALTALPANMDLAIVATTADVRVTLIADICKHTNIMNWVLEKVLAQSAAEIIELQKLLSNSQSVWVNTPMYLWSLYRKIRAMYPVNTPIEASFEGFRNLTCNAIHYIDFISRWNDAAIIEINTSGLESEWYAAKRQGFYEIDGKILANFSDGSKLKLQSERNSLGYKVQLKIAGDEWRVSESEGIAIAANGLAIHGEVEFQSQLTAPMTKAIFTGNPCGLPTLSESAQQHIPFLNILLDHWNQHMPEKRERIPIT